MIFKSKKGSSKLAKAACLGLALLTTAPPALSEVTRVSELVDVDPNVWAYKALKELVEKYDVLEGYPNKTFRGNKPPTRYEMAQALYEVIKLIDLNSADPGDLSNISRLKREFERELADVRNRVASLEGRVSALEAGGSDVSGSWTDRIRITGDLTSNLRTDWADRGNRDGGNWGTRARLGVDAVLIGHDPNSSFLGEGIAHMRFNAGNGGPGNFNYATGGNNLDDIAFDGSNPSQGSNNSLFSGRGGDSRMDTYLDQAYYTQVFKFQKSDPCSNEVREYPNFFAVADIGQQDLWETFHKSLVREDSLDGFINQRVLHGMTGGSDSITESIHLGLNWLGDSNEKQRFDKCGNPKGSGTDHCGEPLPGFFQALSLDYAFATHKYNLPNNVSTVDRQGNVITALDTASTSTTSDVWRNHSHNVALNFMYDLPTEFLGTGLITHGFSLANLDWNGGVFNNSGGNFRGVDDWGFTYFTKWEQFFGKNRTFGLFADYSYANNSASNYILQGPFNQLAQVGVILNTTFMPDVWNFNKDQLGLAYSIADPFNTGHRGDAWLNGAAIPSSGSPLGNRLIGYNGNSKEHIIEAYYRKYLTENLSITPDLMFMLNGNGNNDAVSASLRFTAKLPNWNDGGAFHQFGYRDWSQKIAKYKAANSYISEQ